MAERSTTQPVDTGHGANAVPPASACLASVLLPRVPLSVAAASSGDALRHQCKFALLVLAASCLFAQVAALRQRAFALRMYALILLRCEQASMLEPVLAALLGAASPAAAAAAAAGGYANGAATAAALNPYTTASGGAAMLALQHICSVTLPEPRMDMPADVQQLQQDMTVDDVSVAALLTQPAIMEASGVITRDDYGQGIFNFPVRALVCLQP